MPRKIIPKLCDCGCGEMTRGGDFIPGHDAKLLSSIVSSVGGIANLRSIVEKYIGENVTITESTRERSSQTINNKHRCPECGYKFNGGTWAGIDAHWKAKHHDILPYEEAWPLIQSGKYRKVEK